ncbi:hypothetical protein [Priestia megaterium]|uniref:hypothetical protein n=1 Tax=Priestia megaterium TaxID=1404 RepID=UPI001C24EB3F|nr:hypothetical protein [Priestia megaterium]MBU8689505.1 hypothetical protein [Priestia megaterium]
MSKSTLLHRGVLFIIEPINLTEKNGFNDYKRGFIQGIIAGTPLILRELVPNPIYVNNLTSKA